MRLDRIALASEARKTKSKKPGKDEPRLVPATDQKGLRGLLSGFGVRVVQPKKSPTKGSAP